MNLEDIYTIVKSNTTRGNSQFYKPLDKEMSERIRADYAKRTLVSLEGDPYHKFFTKSGTLLATGYARVVIGD